MSNIRPRNNQLLVEPEPLELMSSGGIHLPEPFVERPMNRTDARWARVIAVGPGKWLDKAKRREPIPFKVGDRVLCNGWMTDGTRAGESVNAPTGQRFIDADDVYAVEEA